MRNLLSSLFLGLIVPAFLSLSPPAAHATGTRVAAFQAGSLHVECHGEGEPALVLIPGLGSGAWVWDDTVAALKDSHRVCAVTLAGFNGTPAPEVESNWMDLAAASLIELIDGRELGKPVLIGHSLGGTLALRFATAHSDRIAGVVAVDGLPVFPGTEELSAEQRQARATMTRSMMSGASQEQFETQQLAYMQRMGVIDQELAARTAKLQAQSDPAAVARYMAEDLALDLRPELDRIAVPVLAISPYNQADFERAAEAGRMPMMSEEQKTAYYRSLLPGIAELEVRSISPARHFVMLDQPRQFHAALADFLEQLR